MTAYQTAYCRACGAQLPDRDDVECIDCQRGKTSTWVRAGRQTKAVAIEHAVFTAGGTAADAEAMDRKGQLTAAKAAGCRPPSEKTWGLVINLLRDRERPPLTPEETEALFARLDTGYGA